MSSRRTRVRERQCIRVELAHIEIYHLPHGAASITDRRSSRAREERLLCDLADERPTSDDDGAARTARRGRSRARARNTIPGRLDGKLACVLPAGRAIGISTGI